VFETVEGQVQAVRYVGVVRDVTERREREEREQLLVREVDHRANNLLTVVQSVVHLSAAADKEALKEAIIGRVHALGRAHQLLSATRWEGADLRRIVEDELGAFLSGRRDRVRISGPCRTLTPAAAQALAMAVHELTTNAVKYGSLSVDEGTVEVAWRGGADEDLQLTWRERNGPTVRPPDRRGFGSLLLRRVLGGQLRGDSDIQWDPAGLVCTFTLPG
jgi:two-component sensor histidine kinase